MQLANLLPSWRNTNDMINLKMSSSHMKGIMSMLGLNPNKVETTKMSQAGKADKMGLFMSANGKYSALRWVVSTPSCAQATLAGIDVLLKKLIADVQP